MWVLIFRQTSETVGKKIKTKPKLSLFIGSFTGNVHLMITLNFLLMSEALTEEINSHSPHSIKH